GSTSLSMVFSAMPCSRSRTRSVSVKPQCSGRLAAARIDFLEFGIDDVVVGRTASVAGRSGLPAGASRGRASQGFGNPGRGLLQTFRRLADRLYVFRRQILLGVGDRLF